MKLAVAQFAATADLDGNLARSCELIDEAAGAGADLVVLPEVSMYFDPRGLAGAPPHGQTLDGPFATGLAEAARRGGVAVIAGMLEATPDRQRDFNTLLAVSAGGERQAVYRKIHLYDAFGFRESDIYLPGPIESPALIEVAGVSVALLTCYDLRFPEAFRWVVDAGADVVALPAAWIAGPAKEAHWQTLLAARAIENTVYVAGAGQTGPVCCGLSQIVDPMGEVVAGAGTADGIAIAPIDPGRIADVRTINPSLANRRFDVMPRAAR